jgi:hypothetical protein
MTDLEMFQALLKKAKDLMPQWEPYVCDMTGENFRDVMSLTIDGTFYFDPVTGALTGTRRE